MIYQTSQVKCEKVKPTLQEMIDAASPAFKFDTFHMNTANIERLKNMDRIVTHLKDPPKSVMSEIAGIKFTVNDMLPDNRIVVCMGNQVVGIIKLGEKEDDQNA